MGKQYHFDWRWTLKSSPAELWDYVGDTNRLNIVTGMPKLTFTEVPQPDGSVRRYAHAPIYSWLALDWEEVPFDWVKPKRHSVKRVFSSRLFPIKWLQNVFNLTPLPDGGTELQFELTMEANGKWGEWFIPNIAKSTYASFDAAFHSIEGYIQLNRPRPFDTPKVPIESMGKQRLDQLMSILRQGSRHQADLVEQFYQHLLAAPVEELTRMRPYRFAWWWGADRTHTLALFLHAANVGILDLSWDILCPECRGDKAKITSLRELAETVHCPSCNIDYAFNFEQSVEATFNINPEIVDVERTDYCIGGPHAMPHVLVQQVLAPGESRQTTLTMGAGEYRLRAPRLEDRKGVKVPASILAPISGQPWVKVSPTQGPSEFTITIQGDRLYLSESVIHAGQLQLTMSNQTDKTQLLIWEDGTWSNEIATAADVTALQAFRDLFSSEALRPGYTVGVQNMVVLFSDLKDSTGMYQRLGDATAFGAVIDHFELLKAAIANHRGGIVKTIGDAVMAVFREPGDALRAALAMQESIRAFNDGHPTYPLTLKLGLHQGPCIAVTLNDRLDYFGSTVNIAARLEGQSQGGDIVISNTMSDAASVQQVLTETDLRVEPYTASLKGFEGQYHLFRICPFDIVEQRTEELWVDVAE